MNNSSAKCYVVKTLPLAILCFPFVDLYVLFEAVRGFGGLEQIAEKRRFALVRDIMLLPLGCAGYSTAMRVNYEKYIKPHEELLEAKVEAAYDRNGQRDTTRPHQWLLDRAGLSEPKSPWSRIIAVRGQDDKVSTSQSIDPEAKEESSFLALPEATQAVLRARLKLCSLEEAELSHSLFHSDEPAMVLLDIRNHIIRMWYRNTRERLEPLTILTSIPARFQVLAARIFTFLECTGVINFGVLPPRVSSRRSPTILPGSAGKRVAIVGAGMSGLIAARQLLSFGFDVTVFEARKRAGGRIYTDNETFSAGVDMGAMLILGVIQNPVSILAHQTGSRMHFMEPGCPLFDIDGSWVPNQADKWAEKEFNAVLDTTARYRDRKSSEEKANKMSLGHAFQKALEKRACRRKTRMQKHVQGARDAAERMRHRQSQNGMARDEEESDFYLEVPHLKGKAKQEMVSPIQGHTGLPLPQAELLSAPTGKFEDGQPIKKIKLEENGSDSRKDVCASSDDSTLDSKEAIFSLVGRNRMDEKRISRLLRWHIANLEYACASDISNVSLRHWDQDDPYAFSGEHVLLKTGYMPLVDGLVHGIERNISFGSKVIAVKYPDGPGHVRVDVQTSEENISSLEFDSVVVSVPLGVLKRKSISFHPPLPKSKQEAIARLGFGGLMKVAMEFESQFWIKPDMFGALRESVPKRGEFYFFWNLAPSTGSPILVAVVAEPVAPVLENLPDATIKDEALKVLRRRYPEATEPIAYSVSRWSQDELCGGAYTYIPVGSSGEDYDLIAAPVGKSIFFAGEHTCKQYPTTCASAIISGLREVHRILEAYDMIEHLADLNGESISFDHDSSDKSSNHEDQSDVDNSTSTDLHLPLHVPFARKKVS